MPWSIYWKLALDHLVHFLNSIFKNEKRPSYVNKVANPRQIYSLNMVLHCNRYKILSSIFYNSNCVHTISVVLNFAIHENLSSSKTWRCSRTIIVWGATQSTNMFNYWQWIIYNIFVIILKSKETVMPIYYFSPQMLYYSDHGKLCHDSSNCWQSEIATKFQGICSLGWWINILLSNDLNCQSNLGICKKISLIACSVLLTNAGTEIVFNVLRLKIIFDCFLESTIYRTKWQIDYWKIFYCSCNVKNI